MKEPLPAARLMVMFVVLLVAAATPAGARVMSPPGHAGDPPAAAPPPQEPEWPAVVVALEGDWEGSGTLFGSPASFTMSWHRSLGDRFVRLVFRNALVTDDGASPVLQAEAFYRPADDGGLAGHWFDTRGEVVTLRARVADDRIVADWQASSESGRTTYRVVDADTVEVVDEVVGADGLQEFGRATYTRR